MAQISVTITAHQQRCIDLNDTDIQALLQSQVDGRALRAEKQIQQSLLDAGKPVSGDPVKDVQSAYSEGLITTAAEREAELASITSPAETDESKVTAELTRRRLMISGTSTLAEHQAASDQGLKAATSINTLISLGKSVSDNQRELLTRLLQASAFEDALIAASKALLAMDKLPENYTDDTYWLAG